MSRAQEQAANAARKACTAWLRSTTDRRESAVAAFESFSAYADDSTFSTEIKNAYLAAWRTTLETA